MTTQINKNENTATVSPQRLLGTYPQKQPGQWMQRIPLFGGRMNSHQWRSILKIARRFTPATPLHLTTRQDIELHDIAEQDIPAVYQELNVSGLNTFGSCGDCVRNITLCSGCEFHPGAFDVWPLAKLVREVLFSSPVLFQLPRKFKVSFSGCDKACARPFVNDLGFVALADGRFRAIGAGSLGVHPQTGIELYPSLTSQQVVWLSVAALELFAELGDRQNRRKARLRHVRQRLGDDEFRSELHRRFEKAGQTVLVPEFKLPQPTNQSVYQTTLQCITAELPLDQAELLAEFCEKNDVNLRINLTHGIELFSKTPIALPDGLRHYENLPTIVACPGNDTCTNGLTNARAMARRLAEQIDIKRWKDKTIAVSGCPNRCTHCAIADIGLTGCIKTIDGNRQEAYHVVCGGGNGKTPAMGCSDEIYSAEKIPQIIEQKLNAIKTK